MAKKFGYWTHEAECSSDQSLWLNINYNSLTSRLIQTCLGTRLELKKHIGSTNIIIESDLYTLHSKAEKTNFVSTE